MPKTGESHTPSARMEAYRSAMNGIMRRLAGVVLAAVVVSGWAGGANAAWFGFLPGAGGHYEGGHYEGEYRKGTKHGRGVMTIPNKGDCYEGEWRDDLPEGQGIGVQCRARTGEQGIGFQCPAAEICAPDGMLLYRGGFRLGRAHGYGVLEFTWDGKLFVGEWREGHLWRGVKSWPYGYRVEGEWRYGKLHGRGVTTYPDGERIEGEYRDGKPHGRRVHTMPDGTRYESEWRNGIRID